MYSGAMQARGLLGIEVVCYWMLRLIKANFSATRQTQGCFCSPTLFADRRTSHVLAFQQLYGGLEVVAHKVKLCAEHRVRILPIALLRRMDGDFRGRKRKNQPTVSCVHRLQVQDVSEEISVGIRIGTI